MRPVWYQQQKTRTDFCCETLSQQHCNQDSINSIVGMWWTITAITSLCLVRIHPLVGAKNLTGEKVLVENHASPVGYQVPNLPDYEIDPTLVSTGIGFLSLSVEFVFGLVLVLVVGAGIVSLAYTSWDETFYDYATSTLNL